MNKVIIYSTPTCVYCKMAKKYFAEHTIAYEEKDVAKDFVAREEMVRKSEQLGVPVIDIDGKIIIGFDQEEIAKILSIK